MIYRSSCTKIPFRVGPKCTNKTANAEDSSIPVNMLYLDQNRPDAGSIGPIVVQLWHIMISLQGW